MVLFRATSGKLGRVFSLGLLLLLVTIRVSRQQGTTQQLCPSLFILNVVLTKGHMIEKVFD